MAEKIDPTIVHPAPDTAANEGTNNKPPPTWNPEKIKPVKDDTKK
jgi:hypothetical protein